MVPLSIKPGVQLLGLTTQCLLAIQVAHSVYTHLSASEMVITSMSEGEHSPKSKHYLGDAFDIRTSNLTDRKKKLAAAQISAALGQNFDVVLEDTHIHVEYDPRRL